MCAAPQFNFEPLEGLDPAADQDDVETVCAEQPCRSSSDACSASGHYRHSTHLGLSPILSNGELCGSTSSPTGSIHYG